MSSKPKLARKGVDIWVQKNMSRTDAPGILNLDKITLEEAEQYIEEGQFNLTDLIVTMVYYEEGMESLEYLMRDYKRNCDYEEKIVPIGEENPIKETYVKIFRTEDAVFVGVHADHNNEELLYVEFDIDCNQSWTVEKCQVSGMEQSFKGKLMDASLLILARHVLLLTVANRIGRKTA